MQTSPRTGHYPIIQRLPANDAGRDYVVGNLHGCRSLLDALLDKVNFDPARDRLFSVGDLIDRGPDSMAALALLEQPWFHAVKGNHEVMLLDYLWGEIEPESGQERDPEHDILFNGGQWLREFIEPTVTAELRRALERIRLLPFLLVVGTGARRFHVVHAGLTAGFESGKSMSNASIDAFCETDRVWQSDTLSPWEYPAFLDDWLWTRDVLKRCNHALPDTSSLSITFCGHSIVRKVRRVGAHIMIDTGAFLTSTGRTTCKHKPGLTLIDAAATHGYRRSPAEDLPHEGVAQS